MLNRTRIIAVLAVALATLGAAATPAGAVPTIRDRQWYLDLLHIREAQKISTGTGVIVAVIDSGVDASHRDLAGQVLPGTAFASGQAGDGRRDEDGHGTGMASLIAGRGGGPNNLLGVAPGAKILPVMNELEDGGEHKNFADAIRWAADHGARVINISETIRYAGAPTQHLLSAVRYAMSKDAVVVAGAGNKVTGSENVTPPADIPGVVAVGGVGRGGGYWSGSATGKEVVLAAPGEDIVSASVPKESPTGYGVGSGTSNATAIVSGVAALIRSKYPDLDAANVVNRLIRSAQDRGPKGRDDRYGFGIVDALAALAPDVPAVSAYPLATADPWSQTPAAAADDARPAALVRRALPVLAAVACLGVLGIAALILTIVLLRRRRRPPG